VGGNAYVIEEHLLIPFSGSQRREEYKRTYNFYLSQCRIQVEMVFGQLTIKWRIFCSNLEVSINKASTIVHVASHLLTESGSTPTPKNTSSGNHR
jgi:hypothetical protein